MKFRTIAAAAALVAAHASAHAWFFFILPGAAMNAKPLANEACVPASAQVGDRLPGPGGSTIQLESITGVVAMCNGQPGGPVLAKFVPAPPMPAPVVTAAPAQMPVAATAAVPGESPSAGKLRELNGLLRDGLITQTDYDTKKAEILKAF